jgi:hypothetical protein
MKRITAIFTTLAVALPCALHAADDPKQRKDLAAVIALQGQPCGEVVSYVVQADNDFLATCKDKNRYRIYVKDGRVVVEKK